jgi:hypothetical protein
MEDRDHWTDSPDVVSQRLREAVANQSQEIRKEQLREAVVLLAGPIKERLATTRGSRWSYAESPSARRLMGRLYRLIGLAARARQSERLARLERALGFLAGGHTSGESLLIEQLGALPGDDEVERLLNRMPSRNAWDEIDVRLTGVIVFGQSA